MIDDLWYKNAVIYSLNVGTFMDSAGDGVGDFEGLSRRLDYLSGLGVTCLWLQPFQRSPNRDNGYDVTDYYSVDPRYGSLGDFVDFANQAKQRGLRIIVDLVLNHTSDQHHMVQIGAFEQAFEIIADWYVWSGETSERLPSGYGFSLTSRLRPGKFRQSGARRMVLPTASTAFPAGPQHRKSCSANRNPTHHGILARNGLLRLPPGRGSLPDRVRPARTPQPAL